MAAAPNDKFPEGYPPPGCGIEGAAPYKPPGVGDGMPILGLGMGIPEGIDGGIWLDIPGYIAGPPGVGMGIDGPPCGYPEVPIGGWLAKLSNPKAGPLGGPRGVGYWPPPPPPPDIGGPPYIGKPPGGGGG